MNSLGDQQAWLTFGPAPLNFYPFLASLSIAQYLHISFFISLVDEFDIKKLIRTFIRKQ